MSCPSRARVRGLRALRTRPHAPRWAAALARRVVKKYPPAAAGNLPSGAAGDRPMTIRSAPGASRERLVPGSGGLDGRDLELESDLVTDQDAAGLERDVPGDAVVLAVDDNGALEADAQVPEGVGSGALELEGNGDGVGDAPNSQVAGELDTGRPSLSNAS